MKCLRIWIDARFASSEALEQGDWHSRQSAVKARMNEKKLHVLLAEAHADETATALRSLYAKVQDGLELTNVSSISTLIATLEIVNPEVIFLDLSLAQPDPLDGIRRVHRSAPSVPLIVLADSSDKDCAVRSLTQGPLDYLIKRFIYSRSLERPLRT